ISSCNCFNWLAPTFRQAHPVGAELPQECVSLMAPTFMSDQFDAMYYVPSYRAWFFRQDLRSAYEYHCRFLQHLQVRQNARRWILKAPTHMFALPALLAVYPDAIFVQTHRAPLDAMASVASLITILRRVFSDAVDPLTVCREAIDYWSKTLNTFLEERSRLAEHRICDVSYGEIRRDPLVAVQRIYAHFGWSLSRDVERRMRRALASQPEQRHRLHRYNLSQFGVQEAETAPRFAAYCDRFGLAARMKPRSDEQTENLVTR
ncbi:MAG TPA: sulfotransferase, partial [Candidatus Udaeobacter sp.]